MLAADNKLSQYSESNDLWPYGNRNAVTDKSTPATVLNMTAGGTITGNAGFLNKPVTDIVINSDGSASFWYIKETEAKPVISTSVTGLHFGHVFNGASSSQEFTVKGLDLKGDVTLNLSDADGAFSVSTTVVTATEAVNGKSISVQFTPHSVKAYNATLTLSSPEAEDVVVSLTGQGALECYAPVMLQAEEQYIGATQFRAAWADQTPAENVASYTLEVESKSTVMFNATESGNATYRQITGITDKYYAVQDLMPAGTFDYRVKALYVDGTESAWSNVKSVTLPEHGYELGDVNHDRQVNVSDVTVLIAYILGGDESICSICGDIDGNTDINVSDVTRLISIILGNDN